MEDQDGLTGRMGHGATVGNAAASCGLGWGYTWTGGAASQVYSPRRLKEASSPLLPWYRNEG